MNNETNETIIDSTNNEQEVELELETESEETVETPVEEVKPVEKPVETPEARLARLKRMVDQQEKKLGVKKEASSARPVETSGVSTQDLVALMKADVAEEDIAEVEDFAKYKKISIAEALKTSTVKSLLAEKREKRETANATNTGSAKRSPAKLTDEAIMDKARKGQEVDVEDLVSARWKEKKENRRN